MNNLSIAPVAVVMVGIVVLLLAGMAIGLIIFLNRQS